LTALVSASVLVLLAIPFFGVKLVATGADVLPRSAGARQVSDTLHREFEANRSESPYLVVHATGSGVRERLVEYGDELRGLPAVASVSAPRLVGPETWQIDVGSREKATSDGSLDLVRDIRASAPPYPMEVGGQAASIVDQKASLESYLPWAVPVVVFVTVVALFLMTGSIVLPFKALVMNTLTLGAAFGVLVLIFQDGRLEGLLGYSARGGLNLTNPPLVFAIVFGLSTDYGVFLLSRIKEARDGGAGDAEAVALGLVRTGRIVTAAAVLFCVAVLAFATSRIVFIKEFGVGTAAAVLIDATIVRALLVPSLMRLLGRHNWWSPRPLARLHQRLGVDESG
jgi:RND superfamily putative drug exporter